MTSPYLLNPRRELKAVLELRQARARLAMTQGQLAKALGLATYRTVCKWENGERSIPNPVLLLARIWTDPECPEKFKPNPNKGAIAQAEG